MVLRATVDSPPTGLSRNGDAQIRYGEVTYRGVRSPFIETGPRGANEAVVFVHGNPGSSEDWKPFLAPIGEFARCIALDMPGFGKAHKPGNFAYSIEGYSRHLDGALRHLGVRRAHVVGHDFGGPWALSWTAGHPERVLSLTLVNIGLMPGYRWHYLARIWRLPLVGEIFMATSTRSAFRMLIKSGNPRGLPKAFVDGMYDNFDRGTRRAVLRLYRATPDPGGLSETLGDALRPLDIPTLVIWGAADPYVPVRFAEVQREFFPAARIVRFDDSGHWPHVDAPERFASELVTFLRDQCGQS